MLIEMIYLLCQLVNQQIICIKSISTLEWSKFKFTIKSNNFGILFELNATMFTIDEQQNVYEAKCNSTHCTATHKVSD